MNSKIYLLVSLLILLLVGGVMAKTPVGLKKWKVDDTTFTKRIGGTICNYEKLDKTWAAIVNDFEVEGDSVVYADKAVLRTRVNKNGVSKVMLTWGDQEYTITQKLLGIGWLKISTRQSKWIDSTMNWSNFSVDSNIAKWTGVSPAVDYRVRKSNGTVEHGIFFKPAFLDSAVILYNQRSDSLDIALANVMVYTLSTNIDNADSAMGDLPKRRLKDFGYYSFNLRNQWLRFPGCDTLPKIPVRQYWERRGTKIICIEYVMMSKIKKVHEAYPSATIWHNDIATIDGTTNVEDARTYKYGADGNYGGESFLQIYSNSYPCFIRVKNVASELGPGATISACACSVYVAAGGFPVVVDGYRVFKPWNEGALTGGANPDDAAFGEGVVTSNDWSNDDEEWTTAGCESADDGGSDNSGDGTGADRKATAESSVNVTGKGWWGWSITSGLAQDWYDGDANENGIFMTEISGGYITNITSTEGASNQPFWTFTYTYSSAGRVAFYADVCTWLDGGSHTTNYGTADSLTVKHSLFDDDSYAVLRHTGSITDSIDTYDTIKAGTLYVYCENVVQNLTLSLDRACKGFNEAYTTFNVWNYNTESEQYFEWGTAGALSQGATCDECDNIGDGTGDDYVDSTGSISVSTTDDGVWLGIPIPVCHITDWLSDSDENNGVKLSCSASQLTLSSDDAASRKPYFVYRYAEGSAGEEEYYGAHHQGWSATAHEQGKSRTAHKGP